MDSSSSTDWRRAERRSIILCRWVRRRNRGCCWCQRDKQRADVGRLAVYMLQRLPLPGREWYTDGLLQRGLL